MKIQILTSAILLILAGTAQASFTYHLPLQSFNSVRGTLPDGSIRFVKPGMVQVCHLLR